MYRCFLRRCRQLAGCLGRGLDAMLRLGLRGRPLARAGIVALFKWTKRRRRFDRGGFENSVAGKTSRQECLES